MNPTSPANADAAAVIAVPAAKADPVQVVPAARIVLLAGIIAKAAGHAVRVGDRKVVPAAMTAVMIVAEAVRARILNVANRHRCRNSIVPLSQTKKVWIR